MEMTKQGITYMINHSEDMIEEILSSINASQLKVLEIIEEDTGAMIKSDSNKAKVTRKSSFRITSIIDTASTEEEEEESDLEEDITEMTNTPVVTPDSMTTDNPSEKPLASNTVNIEESNDDSNLRVESHHTYTEKAEHVLKKDVAEGNARTYVPTYSIYHSDDKNNGSEPGVDTIVNTKVNAGDTLVSLSMKES